MSWLEDRLAGLPMRVQLPRDYGGRRRWPLIVFLHGSGERGDDNRSQLSHGVQHFAGLDAIVAAPQCPRDDSWGGTWFPGPSRAQAALLQLVAELRGRRTVDPKRVVLIAASMGAIGGWEILAKHHGVFDAAALLCGEPDLGWAPLLQGQRIWSFHGEEDDVVPIDKARALHRLLPAPARFTSLPGRGHDLWDPVLSQAELYRWLLSE